MLRYMRLWQLYRKQVEINYEVQFSINQMFKDEVEKKKVNNKNSMLNDEIEEKKLKNKEKKNLV